jgi:hypothetical protein
MSIRVVAFVLPPVILLAGVLAFYGAKRAPDAASIAYPATPAPTTNFPPFESVTALPPNHPAIGAATPQHAWPAADADPAALAWSVPPGWHAAPTSNAMRLATYRVPGGAEVSVSRAGGATEANIQRWIAQFDDVGHEGRAEKTVRGFHVVTVDVSGTYVGGGVTMGGPSEPQHDWAMVGAIVEGASPPYFFKMTGPSAAVRAAKPMFDRLLESIAPT